jgi:hypothetical protein
VIFGKSSLIAMAASLLCLPEFCHRGDGGLRRVEWVKRSGPHQKLSLIH